MLLKTFSSKWISRFLLVAGTLLISQTGFSQDVETNAADVGGDASSDTQSSPAEIAAAVFRDEWFDNRRWATNVDDTSSVFDPLDDHFGKSIVGPVASIFFYDVYYFDNSRAQVFAAVSDLKKAIDGAQKELKKARIQLGLDSPEKDKSAEDEPVSAPGDKPVSSPNLTGIRNGLKTKIQAAFSSILSSKLPAPEIKQVFLSIKEAFFILDFEQRNSIDGKLTKSSLIKAVESIGDAVEQLSGFTSQTRQEIVLTLHPEITANLRTNYFRGHNTDQVEQLIEDAKPFEADLAALVDSKSISNKDGVYRLAQVEKTVNGQTKMIDASYEALTVPFIVLWLVFGAVFFTVRMSFINIRGFKHAIKVTRGDYDDPNDPGEISHFQALSSALSATVGLGNIAGVAIAVSLGGPGAIVWMVIAGFLGMTSKFTECTLGQMYRRVDENGRVLGGPMRYLSAGLSEMKLGLLGKLLAVMFVLLCIGGSFGGGNMFQANQSYVAVKGAIPWFEGKAWLYGILLAFLVGLVILGGIKRIGTAAGVIVPFMCLIYVLAGLFVIGVNYDKVLPAFGTMLREAFSMQAGFGGLIGTLMVGFKRATFSNEAGTGSASIAHSAAATNEPVREGIVALLEPFIDTIVVCTMTGLVVVITGAYQSGAGDGVEMTSAAFASVLPWFPYVLSVAVVLFAFSTMISWSYYGERCAIWLFGESASVPYKFLFLICVFLGAVLNLGNVLDFSDLMILGMAFPNILGLLLLSGKVKRALDDYWQKKENGEFDRD
ncbi:MAG: alanine/glycine:cation symporter family protein [Planctomycetota bacterium]|nr:alanine/glycine:cation symporter family protein [Planctomycetota bacterium]